MVQHGLFNTDKEIKNEILEDGFSEFWVAWPPGHKRKYNKKGCLQRWRTAKLHTMRHEILKALHRQKQSEDWLKQRGEYIPAPLVWLRQERWEAGGWEETVAEGDAKPKSPLGQATSGY